MSGLEKHLSEVNATLKKQRKRLRKRLRAAKRQIERQGNYIEQIKSLAAVPPTPEDRA